MVLRTLIRKELLSNFLAMRLTVALVFTVVLGVLTTVIGSLEYSERMALYQDAVRQEREALAEVTVYSQLSIDLLFPPPPLAILCRGISEAGGLRLGIYWAWRPFPPAPIGGFAGAGSDVMRTLVQADFTTVVALVLSFLAVVLGFDGICGERERGTLRQVLACPVPRAQVVLAKLVGGLLSLWVPLTLALVLALLVMRANPDVALTGDDWLRLLGFYLLSCLFLAQVFALSLLVSVCTRRAATSLIVCLFAWLVAGIGYASVLPSLACYGIDQNPSYQETLERNSAARQVHARSLAAWEERYPPPPEPYMRAWEQRGLVRYGHPDGYAWRQQRNAFAFEDWLDTADERYRIWWEHLSPLARQAILVDAWAILSPCTNYQVLAYRLARTTLDDRLYLRQAGEEYRRTFVSWLRGRDAAGSRRWFTDDADDQELMIPDPQAVTPRMLAPDSPFMQERLAWVRQQEQRAAARPARDLGLADMPRPEPGAALPLSGSLAQMTPGLVVLALTLGLSVLATVARFLRYDPQ